MALQEPGKVFEVATFSWRMFSVANKDWAPTEVLSVSIGEDMISLVVAHHLGRIKHHKIE